MIVDSHLHVWDLEQGEYAWLGPDHGGLYASFSPAQAERELAASGVDAAVLVQAEDSARDTRYLLDVADRWEFVAGVVGWVRLADPAAAAAELDDYGTHPAFRGVRHLVHDDPRDWFLRLPAVRASLSRLEQVGLAFDVPDAWPRHLADIASLADAVPGLRIVVDHLGKPPRGSGGFDAWARALREVARRPNVAAKVSGLQLPGQPLTVDALRPVWDIALEAFGVERLMYGGDWPMTIPSGGYAPTWDVVSGLIAELSGPDRQRILAGTAIEVYDLSTRTAAGTNASSGGATC